MKCTSVWVIWTSGLQECKSNFIFQSRAEWAGCMGFIRAVKEVCSGRSPTLGRCDLVRGGQKRTRIGTKVQLVGELILAARFPSPGPPPITTCS